MSKARCDPTADTPVTRNGGAELESEFKGVKVFSLPSMGADGSRIHVELGVRGDPAQVPTAMERLRGEVRRAGLPYK